MIASPLKSGIWMFRPGTAHWKKEQIAFSSSGFEHATVIADLENNGTKEIYVAADDQHELQRFSWDGQRFTKEVISTISDNMITFGLMAGSL